MIDIENDTRNHHLDSNSGNCSNSDMPCFADTLDESEEPLYRRSFAGDPLVAHFIFVI
jgi:hypothetical protein